ncbi:Pantoate kinase [uncultured archaeon]|nr:Pantoate kinase [uncultured archaeon]
MKSAVSRAWVPSHITGFFAASRREDPLLSGSVGCGLCLTLGATTTIEAASDPGSNMRDAEILLNGTAREAPVSRYVLERLARGPVRVKTKLDMPFGAGFGASGAGALGCAYALNSFFDLGLTANQAAAVAHAAEVTCRTGLGDVIAQNCGGLVVRLEAGAPGTGKIDRIPVPSLPVSYVVRGPISTSEVLSDVDVMNAVNQAGAQALKELLQRPTLQEFMRLSRRFAEQSSLASGWALEAMEAVEAAGGMASMIMLGDAVFAFGGAEALRSFGQVHTTTISQRGANLD